jgi:hypothetical protein
MLAEKLVEGGPQLVELVGGRSKVDVFHSKRTTH